MDASKLNNGSMADVIKELDSGKPTNGELTAALMNAMRRIEELERQIVDLDDSLFCIYRRTGHSHFALSVRDKPSAGTVGHLRLISASSEHGDQLPSCPDDFA